MVYSIKRGYTCGGIVLLRILNKNEKEELQRQGYMCEHLLCLYSMLSNQTALYDDTFPVFINNFREADVILFGLGMKNVEKVECVKELLKLPINTLNIVSPTPLQEFPDLRIKYIDWDFHISIDRFDFNLKGSPYKNIRYRLRQAEKMDYHTRLTKEFTSNHIYILSRHLTQHKFDVWDYEELLSLDRFFREHDHGMIMEVYRGDRLVGFDIVDFLEDNRIMVVPLGIYLESSLTSDFLMYNNLKFARDNGYAWVDVGPACGSAGLRSFKEKWFATPKFKLIVQTLTVKSTQ